MQFLGYARADGGVGVRNHLLVLSMGGLTGPAARRVGAVLRHARVVALPFDGGLIGEDKACYARAALGLARNPNVGATILLGDNPSSLEGVAAGLAVAGRPHVTLSMGDCGNDALTLCERAVREGARFLRLLSGQRRAPAPVSALTLGLECGRSDPSSGLVANPLIGAIADRLTDAGGTVILGETTEWLGAEHLLCRPCRLVRASRYPAPSPPRSSAREAMAVAAGVGHARHQSHPHQHRLRPLHH